MTLFKALATVVSTAIGFGIAGTAIGAFLGEVTPSFLRHTIHSRDPVSLTHSELVELGIGLGLVNGLIWGMVIGVLVVGIVSWRETRMSRKNRGGVDPEKPAAPTERSSEA